MNILWICISIYNGMLAVAAVNDRHFHHDHVSGLKDDQPGPKACLADLRSGDVLVIWKLDHLGRSLPNLIDIITDLKERGAGFRSFTEHMDTTTPQGELLFSLFGALAQYERALIR